MKKAFIPVFIFVLCCMMGINALRLKHSESKDFRKLTYINNIDDDAWASEASILKEMRVPGYAENT